MNAFISHLGSRLSLLGLQLVLFVAVSDWALAQESTTITQSAPYQSPPDGAGQTHTIVDYTFVVTGGNKDTNYTVKYIPGTYGMQGFVPTQGAPAIITTIPPVFGTMPPMGNNPPVQFYLRSSVTISLVYTGQTLNQATFIKVPQGAGNNITIGTMFFQD